MRGPDTIIIDGRAYSWRALCEQRRRQVEAFRKTASQQPALFELIVDRRPAAERRAAGRYLEPTLFTLLGGQG